jgi:Uma2 family endonuclease
MVSITTPTTPPEVVYPSSDGEPMAETEIHVIAIILLLQAVEDALRDRPDDYIAGNIFWYWEEGNPNARCSPDTMVIPGVGRQRRRSFFSWKENGAVPAFICEMASEKTWRGNLHEKRQLYAERGVKEYFVFDPEALYVRPPLRGFRLEQGQYMPLELDAADRLYSATLNLFLQGEGQMLRLIDSKTGVPILTREEQVAKATNEAEAERQRAETEHQRAEQERQRAEQERQRAEQERQRAEALQAELERLQALLQAKQAPTTSNPPSAT